MKIQTLKTIIKRRFISFTFFLILLSLHALLAQAENRLEATNQITGCRLQVLSREQVANNRKIELPLVDLSFQIDRGVESTTNCQLPTANCHLMMDPVTSSTLEGGVKTLLSRFAKPSVYSEEEGAISAIVRMKPSTVNSNSSDSKYVIPENSSVAAHEDTIEQVQGQIDGMTAAAREFETHFSKMIAEPKAQAEKMPTIASVAKTEALKNAQEAAKIIAIAKEITKLQLEAQEKAAEATKKSLEARSNERTTTKNISTSWYYAANSLEKTSKYWTKAYEALTAGKTTFAEGYREAAVTSQRAADQQKLSAQTQAAGKESEGISWGLEGTSLQAKADYQAKAAEAQEAGKTTFAGGYREAAAISERAADQHKRSAQTKAAGKESEGISWYWDGASLQAMANYQAKACEAQEAGKTQLAAAYREAAATSQSAADQHKQSAQTKAAGKESESNSLYWEGASLQAIADYQAKASEAQEAGKTTFAGGSLVDEVIGEEGSINHHPHTNIEVNNFREADHMAVLAIQPLKDAARARSEDNTEVANGYEQIGQYYLQAAQAYVDGNNTKANNFKEAGNMAVLAIQPLKDAARARNEGNAEVIQTCAQIVQYYFQGTQAYVNGNNTKANNFKEAGNMATLAIQLFKDAAYARNQGNAEVAQACEQRAQYYLQAAQAFASEDNTKANDFREAAAMAAWAIQLLRDEAQEKNVGNAKVAQACKQKVQYYLQGAQAFANGHNIEGNNFREASLMVSSAIQSLQAVAQARNTGNAEVATVCDQVAQYSLQGAQAFANGSNIEGNNFREKARMAASTIQSLKDAVRARSEDNATVCCVN